MKQPFLVVHDYETGGLWGVMKARSKAEIAEKFPKLKVIEDHPSWMNDDEYRRIEIGNSFDIDDDPPKGWLAKL
jgi:hypothetical protein